MCFLVFHVSGCETQLVLLLRLLGDRNGIGSVKVCCIRPGHKRDSQSKPESSGSFSCKHSEVFLCVCGCVVGGSD